MKESRQIDIIKALQWLEGDEKMFARIKAIFLKNVPAQVVELKEFLDSADLSAAERGAHTIMGSSAMLGATAMSEKARDIERSSMEGDLNSARNHYVEFIGEFQKVVDELTGDGGAS
ncbi:MAG: Hpt domain-containing protein [Desulfuromonadaceae bacterium]|nr:Hpt domain-containing protein [Desulfuromonadaceae bacterium]MDD2855184.1 Hpt domain-containing protein [Desulfuromonadaceae bacterium]